MLEFVVLFLFVCVTYNLIRQYRSRNDESRESTDERISELENRVLELELELEGLELGVVSLRDLSLLFEIPNHEKYGISPMTGVRSFEGDADGKVIKIAEIDSSEGEYNEEEYERWYIWDGSSRTHFWGMSGESPPAILWKELGLKEDAIDLIGRDGKREKLVKHVTPGIPPRKEWFVNEKGIDAAMAMKEIEKNDDSSSE